MPSPVDCALDINDNSIVSIVFTVIDDIMNVIPISIQFVMLKTLIIFHTKRC